MADGLRPEHKQVMGRYLASLQDAQGVEAAVAKGAAGHEKALMERIAQLKREINRATGLQRRVLQKEFLADTYRLMGMRRAIALAHETQGRLDRLGSGTHV